MKRIKIDGHDMSEYPGIKVAYSLKDNRCYNNFEVILKITCDEDDEDSCDVIETIQVSAMDAAKNDGYDPPDWPVKQGKIDYLVRPCEVGRFDEDDKVILRIRSLGGGGAWHGPKAREERDKRIEARKKGEKKSKGRVIGYRFRWRM